MARKGYLSCDISFPAFWQELENRIFLGLKPASIWPGTYSLSSPILQVFTFILEVYHQLSWVSSLLTVDLGTKQPPYSCESLFFINVDPLGSVSPENPD